MLQIIQALMISANIQYINRFSKLFSNFKRSCYLFSNENNEEQKEEPKEEEQEIILKEMVEKQITLKNANKNLFKNIILRNYHVPQYPYKYQKLAVFLAENKKRFFGKTQNQMKEIVKYLRQDTRQKYEEQLRNYNSNQLKRRRAFGRKYVSPILTLPSYHQLVIAFIKFPKYQKWYKDNLHLFKPINSIQSVSQIQIQPRQQPNYKKQISQPESESESQQRQQEAQNQLKQNMNIYKQFPWPPQQSVKLSAQQIFQMLQKSHPLARYMASQVYDLIHNRYAEEHSTFKNSTLRLPIIWFKHAYQFYLVEQSKEAIRYTQVEKYKQNYQNLSKQQKLKYESMVQHQVLKYNYYLQRISKKIRVSISTINSIQKFQYSPYLQKKLMNMVKNPKSESKSN